ncbi:MAG: guanylate kinase [Anaerolineae bacterium]
MSPLSSNPLAPYLAPAPVLLVITGPSGVGKDSVISEMTRLGGSFHFVVTATNRKQRPDEVDGVDYVFVSTTEFERMVRADELFEYAIVYDQYKGVQKAQVRQAFGAGRDVVMRLDVQGARVIQDRIPGATTIFLTPTSVEDLEDRLRRRGVDTPEQIARRLETATAEIALASSFGYVVVNREGRLCEAARQVLAIMDAEKRRTHRPPIIL